MENKLFNVGFSFYPNESLYTENYYFIGNEEDAKKSCLKQLNKYPIWIIVQIDKNFNSNDRCSVFCNSVELLDGSKLI